MTDPMGDLFSGGVPPEPPPVEDRFKLTELDDFLGQDEEEYDWLVEGVLERGDRLILTGEEGAGKSTAKRQWGVQLASGVNPWGDAALAGPLRVAYVDLENPEKLVRRKLRHVREIAGARYSAGHLKLLAYPQGLDLETPDAPDLLKALTEFKPEVLMIGPLYKMTTGNPSEEEVAKRVARWFDGVRAELNCALVIEAHSAKESSGNTRTKQPYGASLWLRWPEFGLHIGKDGTLSHWRGQRDERDWPPLLTREGEWMWNPSVDAQELEWAKVRAYLSEHPAASQRAIASAVGLSQSKVSRFKRDREADWNRTVIAAGLKDV